MTPGEPLHLEVDELAAQARAARRSGEDLAQEAAWWAQGVDGERRVAELLDGLAPDVVALHDRLLDPGRSPVRLDHVVVTHSGVFLLATKNWQADLAVHHGMLWRHVGPPHSRSHAPQDRALADVARHAAGMAAALGTTPVHPVLVLAADRHEGFDPQQLAGVHVLPMGRLRGWLMRWPVLMDDDSRDELVDACAWRYPVAGTDHAPAVAPRAFDPALVSTVAPSPLPSLTARRTAPSRPSIIAPSARIGRRTRRARRWPRVLAGGTGLVVLASHAPTLGHWMTSLLLAGAAHP